MQISAEYLRNEIAKMQQVVIAHNGAIEFAEHLLSQVENDDGMPVADFAEMVAGNGARVEGIEAVKDGDTIKRAV